ncbi:Relaxin receptor 1 [Labeo rohita]|uniref:Relaxin receptor 1 n=1 Tax=Labeo rohita TaxID=84645 RepID=A0ABQ8MUC5_LABRO|nr:Relaxin receptor 1 [Labeo rohita]
MCSVGPSFRLCLIVSVGIALNWNRDFMVSSLCGYIMARCENPSTPGTPRHHWNELEGGHISGATELRISPEPVTSDQATVLATGKSAMGSKGAEEGSAYCTMAEGELSSADCALPAILLSSSACPKLSVCPELSVSPVSAMEAICELSVCPELSACPEMTTESPFPTTCVPVLTITTAVSWQPLCSSSAHHLCGGIATGLLVSICIMAGGFLVSVYASWTLPRPVDPASPPGSLVPPALPRSVINHPLYLDSTPLATPRPSIPYVLSGSSFFQFHHRSPSRLRTGSRLAPSCLLPGSSLCLIHPVFSCFLLGSLSQPCTLFVVLLLGVCHTPEPPPRLSICLPASPSLSPVAIRHSLFCPPPKFPFLPLFVSAA